jgi:hypothetical protein
MYRHKHMAPITIPHPGMELSIKDMIHTTSYMCCTTSYIYRNTNLTKHTHPAALQQALSSHGGQRRSFRAHK